MIRIDVISVVQVKIGMRMSVMPGARMFMMVTMKLNAPSHRGDPEKLEAEDPEVDSRPGRDAVDVSGA